MLCDLINRWLVYVLGDMTGVTRSSHKQIDTLPGSYASILVVPVEHDHLAMTPYSSGMPYRHKLAMKQDHTLMTWEALVDNFFVFSFKQPTLNPRYFRGERTDESFSRTSLGECMLIKVVLKSLKSPENLPWLTH